MKRLLLSLVFLLMPVFVQAQTGFITGYMLGSMNSGSGEEQSSAMPAHLLYQAKADTIAKYNPFTFRMAAKDACFESGMMRNRQHARLWDLFVELTPKADSYQILQIVRIPHPTNSCAVIWFTYVEKESK